MYITGAQNLRKTSRTELLHMPISERIKTVRGSLSRAAFAKKIKITESTLRNYESGLSLPNSDTIAIICETCDTDPEWLILGTGSMHPNDTSAVQQHATTQSESTASEPCVRCAKLEKSSKKNVENVVSLLLKIVSSGRKTVNYARNAPAWRSVWTNRLLVVALLKWATLDR